MPCNSDYLNPTRRETELREAAYLLEYVMRELGEIVPAGVQAAARDPYCNVDYVARLCGYMQNMTEDAMNRIAYNGKSKDARTLANWWDRHLVADKLREAKQRLAERKAELIRSAKAKLTEEEWQAVISRS